MILTRRNRSESGIRLLHFASHLQANAPPPAQPRRDTPVKVRAENAGVFVHPTPGGVRERIADDGVSPGTLHLARQQLRGHQKAAQKAVERAELKKLRSSVDSLTGVDVPPGRVFKWNMWLKRKKLQWHSHRIVLRHKQEQRRIDLAKELRRNERTSCSEEACAEMTGEELMAKASYHSKMASCCLRNHLGICPQGSFEVRPKGRFDFYRLQRSTCFPCGVRDFARAVLKRAENLARLDEDDKAGEPFGFTSLMRHNAFQVMKFERPLDPRLPDTPQRVRDYLRGSRIDAAGREQLATARRAESFDHAAIAEELQDIRQTGTRNHFETLEEASVYASRFFQVKRICGFVEEAEHFKLTELEQRKSRARLSAMEAWRRWFPDLSASDLSDAIVEI